MEDLEVTCPEKESISVEGLLFHQILTYVLMKLVFHMQFLEF